MTLIEFADIGHYIAKKTNKETTFNPSIRRITNKEFNNIYLMNNVCCIKHIEDKRQFYRQYKTLNNVKKYIDKWVCKEEIWN